MIQEVYPVSNLDSLLSKDNNTDDDLLQLPELLPEEPKNPPSETPLTDESENLAATPTDKPKIAVNYRAKKQKSTILSRQLLRKQKKSEQAMFRYSFTTKPKITVFPYLQNHRKQLSVEKSVLGS